MKRSPLERRTPLRARRRRAPGTRDQQEAFRRRVTARGRCAVTDDGGHADPLEAHHVIPQQAIKRLGLDERALASRLWDPRNGIAVCGRHHRRHERAIRRIPRAAVPPAAAQFAREVGLDRLLDRLYRETDEKEAP